MKSLIHAVAILLLINSCATDPVVREEPHLRLNKSVDEENIEPIYSTTANASDPGGVEDVELKEGNGKFINEKAAMRKRSVVSADG